MNGRSLGIFLKFLLLRDLLDFWPSHQPALSPNTFSFCWPRWACLTHTFHLKVVPKETTRTHAWDPDVSVFETESCQSLRKACGSNQTKSLVSFQWWKGINPYTKGAVKTSINSFVFIQYSKRRCFILEKFLQSNKLLRQCSNSNHTKSNQLEKVQV